MWTEILLVHQLLAHWLMGGLQVLPMEPVHLEGPWSSLTSGVVVTAPGGFPGNIETVPSRSHPFVRKALAEAEAQLPREGIW